MKKILVVDDEPMIVKMIVSRLQAAGYEVISAYDGEEGLEKSREEKPDLILLDLMLPKIDGYKVCRLLKFDEQYRHIKVLILTARAQEKDRAIALDAGADDYVAKPFEGGALVEKIKEHLNTSE